MMTITILREGKHERIYFQPSLYYELANICAVWIFVVLGHSDARHCIHTFLFNIHFRFVMPFFVYKAN